MIRAPIDYFLCVQLMQKIISERNMNMKLGDMNWLFGRNLIIEALENNDENYH